MENVEFEKEEASILERTKREKMYKPECGVRIETIEEKKPLRLKERT